MTKTKQTPESAVLREILDYLTAKRIFSIRMNTGAMSAEHNGKKRFMRFGVPGMADVLAFPVKILRDRTNWGRLNGEPIVGHQQQVVWIECKAPNGKQSELQKSFQAQVEEQGHKYVLVRSVEDVQAALGI